MRGFLFAAALLGCPAVTWAGAGFPGEGVEEFHALFMKFDLGTQAHAGPQYERTYYYYGSSGSTELNQVALRLSFGYQSPYLLGLHGGINFATLYTASMGPLYFAGPTLRLPTPGLAGRPLLHSLDANYEAVYLPDGYINYTSSSSYDRIYGDILGAYSLSYGMEQMLGRRFSIGLKVGYLFANVPATVYKYRYSNVYPYSTSSTERTNVDMSGLRFALSLNFWPKQPYLTKGDREAAEKAEARRRERQRQRYGLAYPVSPGYGVPPAELPSDPNDLPFASAREALAWGDHHLNSKRYAQAASAYRSASKLDPFSPRVWRSLGKAEYLAGRHIAALRAYERASDLEPNDQALKDFIVNLRKKLGAQE